MILQYVNEHYQLLPLQGEGWEGGKLPPHVQPLVFLPDRVTQMTN